MFNRLYTMTHECKPSRREPISPVSNINHSRAFGPAHGQGHSPAAVRWHTPRPVPSVICISRVLVWFSRGRRFLLVGASLSFSSPCHSASIIISAARRNRACICHVRAPLRADVQAHHQATSPRREFAHLVVFGVGIALLALVVEPLKALAHDL